MPRPDVTRLLLRARTLANAAEAREFYDAWAETYDEDVYKTLRITGTARIAVLLHKFARGPAMSILDAGCGTGAGGQELRHLGFTIIDGLDLSPGMLAVARRRGVYRHLFAADLLKPLALRPESYDAILSAGTFTAGHVDSSPLRGLLGAVKPQGLLAIVVASGFWSSGGFEAAIAGLSAEQAIELLHCDQGPIAADGEDRGYFLILRRAAFTGEVETLRR
jgi:predicted TPR repeat methyltransferase